MVRAVKKSIALAHFVNDTQAVAEAAGVTRQAVEQWPPVVPWQSAIELEATTKGALKVDHELYRKKRRAA